MTSDQIDTELGIKKLGLIKLRIKDVIKHGCHLEHITLKTNLEVALGLIQSQALQLKNHWLM